MTTITLDIPERLIPLLDTIGDQLPLVLEMGTSRLAPVSTQAYIEAMGLLTQESTPQEIADFRFSAAIETRVESLLEKQKVDALSTAEEVELERLARLEEQLELVKARALAKLHTA